MKGCANGVVIFSMGSMVRASSMDAAVRDSMVDVLGRLDQCVLWKWEETIPKLPGNIRTVKWLPQADALGEEKELREKNVGGNLRYAKQDGENSKTTLHP